jgi:hypothetical protein
MRVLAVSCSAAWVILTALFCTPAYGQTIWCKHLKLGCLTLEEKRKAVESCNRIARIVYDGAFTEALKIDEYSGLAAWQLGGYESPNNMARGKAEWAAQKCLKQYGLL